MRLAGKLVALMLLVAGHISPQEPKQFIVVYVSKELAEKIQDFNRASAGFLSVYESWLKRLQEPKPPSLDVKEYGLWEESEKQFYEIEKRFQILRKAIRKDRRRFQ